MPMTPRYVQTLLRVLSLAIAIAICSLTALPVRADEPPAQFFRGINLNGPAVVIDGQKWEAGDTPHLQSQDQAFENQSVPLIPSTDAARALMIRSSRWNSEAHLTVTDVPDGPYAVFLYAWEDNNPETFSISLNGKEVLAGFVSGSAGMWKKLGPWRTNVADGKLHLTTKGGHANLSGLEIWQGSGPIPDPPSAKPRRPLDPVAARFFDQQVAPILARHCAECHGGSERKGELSLATEEAAFTGGTTGPALVAGKPGESLLQEMIDSNEMPQKRTPLTAAEKQLLRSWVTDGAKWGTVEINGLLVSTERRAGLDWWSLQPITSPVLPAVQNKAWVRNEIDAFVLAKLEAQQLGPAPEADRRTLIRRLYFDLTGLPPDPAVVERFLQDSHPDAYQNLVEELLASPHYGERWARHWMDVIRFGESQGYERNKIRENAWRYRDWLITAFNQDLPFDEFIRRQIAGDVLYPDDLSALIATGYHVCGTWDQVAHNDGSLEMRKAHRHDEMEDLVATLSQSFLGLTVNCARCHDHKFDPILQRDYYRIAALLGGVNQKEKERQGITLQASSEQIAFAGTAHVIIPEPPQMTFILARGDYRQPREAVAPAGLSGIRTLPADFNLAADAPDAERRKELARWLTDERHPLPARVFVNRLWHHHFGQGIVDTPSDFGYSGGRPSHPELLDYLASRFIRSGWKIKDLHRLMVMSATYRQASRVRNPAADKVDADNHLLWRANPRRLEGEAVRDAALAVSGALNRQVGGRSYRDMKADLATNDTFTDPTNEFTPDTTRRTIYRLWARCGNNPLLESLDCPDPAVMSPRRPHTITPVQALSLLNNAYAEKTAEQFARRVRDDAVDDVSKQIDRCYRLAFARSPNDREREIASKFVTQFGVPQFCLVLLNSNEFVFVE